MRRLRCNRASAGVTVGLFVVHRLTGALPVRHLPGGVRKHSRRYVAALSPPIPPADQLERYSEIYGPGYSSELQVLARLRD